MTSKDIDATKIPYYNDGTKSLPDIAFWLCEIAHQLAVMNEREDRKNQHDERER